MSESGSIKFSNLFTTVREKMAVKNRSFLAPEDESTDEEFDREFFKKGHFFVFKKRQIVFSEKLEKFFEELKGK